MYLPGKAFTTSAGGTITAGQAVEVAGSGTVTATTGVSAKCVGHAATDAVSGARVLVFGRGTIHECVSTGAITAGDQVASAAAGAVASLAVAAAAATGDINNARSVLGIALTTAAGNRVQYMEI
jgi:hypothetical protein